MPAGYPGLGGSPVGDHGWPGRVAYQVDVGLAGAPVAIGGDDPGRGQAGPGQVQGFQVGHAANGHKGGFGREALAGGSVDHYPLFVAVDVGGDLVVDKAHAPFLQRFGQEFGGDAVEAGQNAKFIHQPGHLDAQVAEQVGEFGPGGPGANDDDALGQLLQVFGKAGARMRWPSGFSPAGKTGTEPAAMM